MVLDYFEKMTRMYTQREVDTLLRAKKAEWAIRHNHTLTELTRQLMINRKLSSKYQKLLGLYRARGLVNRKLMAKLLDEKRKNENLKDKLDKITT